MRRRTDQTVYATHSGSDRIQTGDKPGTGGHDEEPFGSDGLGLPSSGSIPAAAHCEDSEQSPGSSSERADQIEALARPSKARTPYWRQAGDKNSLLGLF